MYGNEFQDQGSIVWMLSHAFQLNQCTCNLHEINGWPSTTFHRQLCHFLSRWYLDFQSIMGRTCKTTLTSFRHSTVTSTISEHGQMLICDDQHQVFGVCNWLCRYSCRPKKIAYPQILAHSSKNSWTKNFS